MRVSRTREGTLLSVMMYRFCSNNTLYSASLSFTTFIFRFKSQITIFFSNLSLLMYIKCWCIYVLLIKKHLILPCSFLNIKKLSLICLFLCFSCISLGQHYQKNVSKVGDWGKRYKGSRWLYKGVVYRTFKPPSHYDFVKHLRWRIFSKVVNSF